MAKSASSYARSRFNAGRWFTSSEGVIPCIGSRCRYLPHCPFSELGTVPVNMVGSDCLVESVAWARWESYFRDEWQNLAEYDADFDELVTEAANIQLGKDRARERGNRSWDFTDASGNLTAEAYHEFNQAHRHYMRQHYRWKELLVRVSQAREKYQAHLRHLKGLTRPVGAPDSTIDADRFEQYMVQQAQKARELFTRCKEVACGDEDQPPDEGAAGEHLAEFGY